MLSDREDDFRKLLDTHAGAMYRQALRILGNRQDAEDAVQDALLRIWKHRRTFGNRSNISTWIFRITYNASRAVKERRDRSGFWAQFLDHESPPRATPELEVQAEPQSPLGEDMARLLSLLPPVQAAALSLFYVEELEYKEIARVLKMPPGSVATAIHRGKQRLRAILMRHDGGPHGKL